MTEGVGIDIIDVARVAQRDSEKENGFKEMIFSVEMRLTIANQKLISLNIMPHVLQQRRLFLKRLEPSG